MRHVDRTGVKHGKLLITGKAYKKGTYWHYFCLCDCGKSITVSSSNLGNGTGTMSCGCSKDGNPTHGLSNTFEHRVWKGMRKRCLNPNVGKIWKHYGGKGIKVCKRWNKFENFFADMGKAPSEKHSIERKNGKQGYNPANCVWATDNEQARNHFNSVKITYQDTTKHLLDWADEYGIPHDAIRARYYRGDKPPRLFRPKER